MSGQRPFPRTQPLQQVLRRVSEHLDHLAQLAHEVEQTVAEDLGQRGARDDGGNLKRLQNLDFIRQYSEDLALLMLHLSKLERSDVLTGQDAILLAEKVRLESTRKLLLSKVDVVTQDSRTTTTGDFDLF